MAQAKIESEKAAPGFKCLHCGRWVPIRATMGVRNRNHCPFCCYSKHVDLKRAGDRQADCGGEMKAIALAFKKTGTDKYGKEKPGELMLVHKCLKCGKISLNRLAADDQEETVLAIWQDSLKLDDNLKISLQEAGIDFLREKDRSKIQQQLWGP